jgi:hypothetical protein
VKRLLSCSLVIVFLFTSPSLFADQKIKKRMSFGEQGFDSTSYVKGPRSRDEMNMGPMQMITVHQCDTGKIITLNDRTKTYMVTVENQPTAAPAATAAAKTPARPGAKAPPPEADEPADNTPGRKGGVVTISTSVQDTGERKDFFGYPARHVKMAMSMESSPDACNPGSMKMTSDGWYIDFEPGVHSCERPERQIISGGGPMGRSSKPGCQDRIKYTGAGVMAMTKLGYGVDVTTTMADKNGKETSFRQQALEISKATLDPALFEPPAGYREVKSYAEMMGMGNLGDIMSTMGAAANNSRMNVPRAAAPTPEVRPKQPGKLRIGVVALGNKTGQAGFDGSAFRPPLVRSLERFDYDVIAVDGDDSAAMADAKRKDCDYVLFTDVSAKEAPQKRKMGGMFGKALAIGVMGSAGASVPTGAGFEGTVEYRLFKIDQTTPQLEGKAEAKGNPQESIPATFDQESRDVARQIQKDIMSR